MAKLLKDSIIENVPFWILAGIAVIIGIIAFFIPPKAEIHPSVLRYISWLFAFSALWTVFMAMMRGIDARITHGKTSVTLGSLEGSDPKNDDDAMDDKEE